MEFDLEEFEQTNEDELNCIFAESGQDREMDFDREQAVEKLFDNEEIYKNYNLKWR